MRYDIVMLSRGQVALTERCLESILQNSQNYRLIWVDNMPARSAYGGFKDRMPIVYLPQEPGIGFTLGANLGMGRCDAPYQVLLNDDTEVPPNWLPMLESGFAQVPKLAAIGTLSTSPRQWQFEGLFPNKGPVLITNPCLTMNHPAIGTTMLAFFCTMFSRESWAAIGPFDERFSPGFGEDDWFCAKAYLAGWSLAVHTGVTVKHAHHASWTDEERKRLQERNRHILKETFRPYIRN